MHSLQILALTIASAAPLTALAFSAGALLGGGRGASSLCALFIVWLCWSDYVHFALGTFVCYLALDATVRFEPMPADIIAHHGLCILLSLSGLFLTLEASGATRDTLDTVIYHLLCMEATSPLLHAGWGLKAAGHRAAAGAALLLLIVAWVPARLIGPAKAFFWLIALCKLFSHPLLIVATTLVGALVLLQVAWFFRLCALALSFIHNFLPPRILYKTS